jgi:hypothetical protein
VKSPGWDYRRPIKANPNGEANRKTITRGVRTRNRTTEKREDTLGLEQLEDDNRERQSWQKGAELVDKIIAI